MASLILILDFIFSSITGILGSESFQETILLAPFVFLFLKYIIDFFKALTRSL